MGQFSTAKIPVRGKVNTDKEVLMNAYATAYDSINRFMLSRQFGRFDKTTPREIHGRFSVLKSLCKKHCPSKLGAVSRLESLSLAHANGSLSNKQFLVQTRSVLNQNKINASFLGHIEAKVNSAEMLNKQKNRFITPKLPVAFRPPKRPVKPLGKAMFENIFSRQKQHFSPNQILFGQKKGFGRQ